MNKIRVGDWRDDSSSPMQVVSGQIDKEKVHYEAPPAARLPTDRTAILQPVGVNPLRALRLLQHTGDNTERRAQKRSRGWTQHQLFVTDRVNLLVWYALRISNFHLKPMPWTDLPLMASCPDLLRHEESAETRRHGPLYAPHH